MKTKILFVSLLVLFFLAAFVVANAQTEPNCFLKSTWSMENPSAPGHWVLERYFYCDYPGDPYAEMYPDNRTTDVYQCSEPGFTWCREIYLNWFVPDDVPRGDLIHFPEIYLFNHPCVSIEHHKQEHANDLYLGGDCDIPIDPTPQPTPTSPPPDDLDEFLFLPIIQVNPPHECITPNCVPFSVAGP